MTMSSNLASRGGAGDGIRERTLPITGDLKLESALSLLVAVLMAVVSVAGPLLGSRGLYGVDPRVAAGVATGPAGVLVPGFLAQDALNLVVGLPVLKNPTVPSTVPGGRSASKRKLYNVPQRIAFAFGFTAKVSHSHVNKLEVCVAGHGVLLKPPLPTVPSFANASG